MKCNLYELNLECKLLQRNQNQEKNEKKRKRNEKEEEKDLKDAWQQRESSP